ncbi:MAG: hypothetical protein HWN67_21675 [Candidatus Helarchaeota archaeon]|nr:hypothetical protein [Candidatus Helarchaeota archaeon]
MYGSKGVANASNVPGARERSISWIDSNDTLWLFGGYGWNNGSGGFLNDLWKYDGVNWIWVSGNYLENQLGTYGIKGMPNANNVPGDRAESISWIDSNDTLWLFGGYGYDNVTGPDYLNDLWKFDITSELWTWVSGSYSLNQSGTYGTKGVPDANNVPGGRAESVSWIDSNDTLWLFGGYGFDNASLGELNDLWKYDSVNWTWESGYNTKEHQGTYGTKGVADANNVPGSRKGAVSGIDSGGNFWLFGGFGGGSTGVGWLNDLWKYDGANWTWVSGNFLVDQYGTYGTKGVADANNVPGGRFGSVSGIDSGGNFWLFGGQDNSIVILMTYGNMTV